MKNDQSKYFLSSAQDLETLENNLKNNDYIHGSSPGLQDNLFYYQFFTTKTEPCKDIYPHIWEWYVRASNFDEKTIESWKNVTTDESKDVLNSKIAKTESVEIEKNIIKNSKKEISNFDKSPKLKDYLDADFPIKDYSDEMDFFNENDDEDELYLEMEKQKALTKKKMQMSGQEKDIKSVKLMNNVKEVEENIGKFEKKSLILNESAPKTLSLVPTDTKTIKLPGIINYPKKVSKSMVVLEIKCLDLEYDLEALAGKIRQLIKTGLTWKGHKVDNKRLKISCIVEDDLIIIDDLIEEIQSEWSDEIDMIDILSYNKI